MYLNVHIHLIRGIIDKGHNQLIVSGWHKRPEQARLKWIHNHICCIVQSRHWTSDHDIWTSDVHKTTESIIGQDAQVLPKLDLASLVRVGTASSVTRYI
jgi:hypothetical protein